MEHKKVKLNGEEIEISINIDENEIEENFESFESDLNKTDEIEVQDNE